MTEPPRAQPGPWPKSEYWQQKAQVQNARARRKEVPGFVSGDEIEGLVRYFKGLCAYCGEELLFGRKDYRSKAMQARRLVFDHVLAMGWGGANVIENLVPSCRDCDRVKAQHEGLLAKNPERVYALSAAVSGMLRKLGETA